MILNVEDLLACFVNLPAESEQRDISRCSKANPAPTEAHDFEGLENCLGMAGIRGAAPPAVAEAVTGGAAAVSADGWLQGLQICPPALSLLLCLPFPSPCPYLLPLSGSGNVGLDCSRLKRDGRRDGLWVVSIGCAMARGAGATWWVLYVAVPMSTGCSLGLFAAAFAVSSSIALSTHSVVRLRFAGLCMRISLTLDVSEMSSSAMVGKKNSLFRTRMAMSQA